VVKAREY
jgi:hypothetical protein